MLKWLNRFVETSETVSFQKVGVSVGVVFFIIIEDELSVSQLSGNELT